jgi:hypothetical protein
MKHSIKEQQLSRVLGWGHENEFGRSLNNGKGTFHSARDLVLVRRLAQKKNTVRK